MCLRRGQKAICEYIIFKRIFYKEKYFLRTLFFFIFLIARDVYFLIFFLKSIKSLKLEQLISSRQI